jgi:predicted acyl esterase
VRPPTHEYRIEQGSIAMPDGTALAVTWWIPTPRTPGERFPALLEMLPYRKDDSFYARDFPLYDWFARRGFLLAKVDVRGTGGSAGRLPDREYSDAELGDAVRVIAALAADPRSNGRVGMWGISWGGFNAIQVALRAPPALKAILALHASDDLFHDDVRYIDGVLHVDRYALQIDHENGLPRTPDYVIDSAYFRDRFDVEPWILTYLRRQEDGPFWRENGWRFRRDDLRVPTYLIGGLLDGYRDTPIRALDSARAAPLKVEIGPWVHAWPDNGTPGPAYEWRERAARWWDTWLSDRDSGLMEEPRLLVFQRTGQPPDAKLAETAGHWRFEDWPVRGARRDTLPLAARDADSLRYAPGAGTAAGEWWGEPTADMAADDALSLRYDMPVDSAALTLLGMPRVRLVVRHGAPLAHWTARLEDVGPDGRVALITGGAINATMRRSTVTPERPRVGALDTLDFDLHFTTWTVAPGHVLRLAVANAQFPMLWPSPDPMVSVVLPRDSRLILPVVPAASAYPAPRLPRPTPRPSRPDVTWLADTSAGPVIAHDPGTGETSVRWLSAGAWTIGTTRYDDREEERYRVADGDPAGASFDGRASRTITRDARALRLETHIEIRGVPDALDVSVTRTLSRDDVVLRERTWRDRIARRWH